MMNRLTGAVDSSAQPQRPPKATFCTYDLIIAAVHRACDLHELDAAAQLLKTAEASLRRGSGMLETKRRHALEALVAAHARLWMLRRGPDGTETYLRPPKHLQSDASDMAFFAPAERARRMT